MDIRLHAGGKFVMGGPQQKWNGDEIMQTSLFAGHEMIAITDDAGAYDLLYLHFKQAGFETMEAAKTAAPEFAQAVLKKMIDQIKLAREASPESPSL